MILRILPFLMLPLLGIGQTNSKVEKPIGELLSNEISPNEMKRNASFNLDEIKVRWKKAALENCTGAPCASISAPGPVTNIVATPTGPTTVRVSFVPPASTGGSPIKLVMKQRQHLHLPLLQNVNHPPRLLLKGISRQLIYLALQLA